MFNLCLIPSSLAFSASSLSPFPAPNPRPRFPIAKDEQLVKDREIPADSERNSTAKAARRTLHVRNLSFQARHLALMLQGTWVLSHRLRCSLAAPGSHESIFPSIKMRIIPSIDLTLVSQTQYPPQRLSREDVTERHCGAVGNGSKRSRVHQALQVSYGVAVS